MNRNRLLIGLTMAILIAIALSTYVYREFKRVTNVKAAATQQIVVAAQPLQLGTRLSAYNLKTITWPVGEPVKGMFADINDCANRALITPVMENEPILEMNLAPLKAGAGLSATIPEGKRAISVAVNEVIGVAGFVIPGTMVDVLVTARVPGAVRGGEENITRTILENVAVLAAGQKIEQDRDGKPQTVPVITLLVSPEEAGKLAMASTDGKIQLALRNTIDTKTVNPPSVLDVVLFSTPRPAFRRAAPGKPLIPVQPPYIVEVISGNHRENKSFTNP
jgi:pilus assembly protein CpaB